MTVHEHLSSQAEMVQVTLHVHLTTLAEVVQLYLTSNPWMKTEHQDLLQAALLLELLTKLHEQSVMYFNNELQNSDTML